MKKTPLYLALIAAIGITACSHQKPVPQPVAPTAANLGPVAVEVTTLSAKVKSVDVAHRTVVLNGANNKPVTLKVATNVPDLENVKPGDAFVVKYSQAVAVGLTPVSMNAQPLVGELHTVSLAPKSNSAEPYVKDTDTQFEAAKIVKIDAKKRTATLEIPNGQFLKVNVDNRVLNLKDFKVGDAVVVEYVQSFAVGFVRPKK